MSKRSFVCTQILAISLLVLSLIQCKPQTPEQKEINQRHDEIMVIHDEVMPMMKDIYQLKKELKNSSQSEEAQTLIKSLDDADEAMMDWMAGYDKPSASDGDYKAYLDQQMVEVKKMQDVMLTSIDNARKYLQ